MVKNKNSLNPPNCKPKHASVVKLADQSDKIDKFQRLLKSKFPYKKKKYAVMRMPSLLDLEHMYDQISVTTPEDTKAVDSVEFVGEISSPTNYVSSQHDITTNKHTNSEVPFSPQPSTSRDNEIILKNDQMFLYSVGTQKYSEGNDNSIKEVDAPLIGSDMEMTDAEITMETIQKSKCPAQDIPIKLLTQNILSTPNIHYNIESVNQSSQTIEIDDDDVIHVSTTSNVCNITEQNIEVADDIYEISDTETKNDVCIDVNNYPGQHVIAKTDLTGGSVTKNKSLIDKTLNVKNIEAIASLNNANEKINEIHYKISVKTSFCQHFPKDCNGIKNVCTLVYDEIKNLFIPQPIPLNNSSSKKCPQKGSTVNSVKSQSANCSKNVELPPVKSGIGTCPVCLDDLSRESVGSTYCGHLFCIPCIKSVLQRKPKMCPTCRKTLIGIGYHQIFM